MQGRRGIKEFATLMNASIKSLGATSLVAVARVTSDSSFKKNQSGNQSGGAERRAVCVFGEVEGMVSTGTH